MKGDEACAFRSVVDQRFGTQEKHPLVREAACNQDASLEFRIFDLQLNEMCIPRHPSLFSSFCDSAASSRPVIVLLGCEALLVKVPNVKVFSRSK
ncbi:hypothetical protein Tco_1418768 [Tanacetum coccineum]